MRFLAALEFVVAVVLIVLFRHFLNAHEIVGGILGGSAGLVVVTTWMSA